MSERHSDALLRYEAIVSAGEALFSEGYEKAQPQKIADRAGVSVGLFYRHFSNKRQLLTAIINSHLSRLHDTLEEEIPKCNSSQQALETAILLTLNYFHKYRDLIKLFFMEIGYGDSDAAKQLLSARKRYRALLLKILRNGVSQKIFIDETQIDFEITINSIVGTINWSIYNTLVMENKNLEPEELASQISRLVLRAITA